MILLQGDVFNKWHEQNSTWVFMYDFASGVNYCGENIE